MSKALILANMMERRFLQLFKAEGQTADIKSAASRIRLALSES
jgi:hypothetical protein